MTACDQCLRRTALLFALLVLGVVSFFRITILDLLSEYLKRLAQNLVVKSGGFHSPPSGTWAVFVQQLDQPLSGPLLRFRANGFDPFLLD